MFGEGTRFHLPQHSIQLIKLHLLDVHRTKKVPGKGLELLGGFYQPSQHRVRIDLKDPRRGTNASAFG
jgi:hypothetical protein